MSTMPYEVVVTREDDTWLANVPALEGSATFAHSLDKLREYVREVIVLGADLPDDAQPEFTFRLDLDDPDLQGAVEVAERRRQLAAAEDALREQTTATIHALRGAGHSVRDVAALVGITPGRVSQIAPEAVAAAAPPRSERTVTETRITGRAMTVRTYTATHGGSVTVQGDARAGSFKVKKPKGS